MNYLEKVKTLFLLNRLRYSLPTDESHLIDKVIKGLEVKWKMDLTNSTSTSPKMLFGKSYREMTRAEIAEYSQIKRLIRRNIKHVNKNGDKR